SASPVLYSSAIAGALGVDAVIATRLAVDDDGRLTGRYDGLNCRGEEKRRRVLEWRASRPDPGPLVAYGNSRGDRRLLAAADVGVDVGRLGRFGALRRFPRLAESPVP
ncbi:MAG TPA: HAD-IB family phosphatase, partial [Acidimicrobiales bacterium]|nr:HAD-IB family phosphatase [Acidimicrobiales bacterium]